MQLGVFLAQNDIGLFPTLGPIMDVMAISNAEIASSNDNQGESPPSHPVEDQNTSNEIDNKFQKAIGAWRSIDLHETIRKLDSTASEIVAHQRDSIVQRKDLAQKTKDFRKLDDAGKLGEYKGLLKAYQTFIDLLTNHGKDSSAAFLQLYSSLSEAPDPYPLLEASVESLVISEDTLPKVNAEKEHLQQSVNKISFQLEETEKRLEDERTLRKQLESAQESKAKDIEASWTRVLEEKQENWDATKKALEEKVENQDRLLKELKANYEVSQRLDQGGDGDTARSTATAAELDIVTSELERTSHRLADMEARNEQLRKELAQAVSSSQTEKSNLTVEEDPSYLRLQSENSSLLRKLESARFEKETLKGELDSKIRNAERQKSNALSENDDLREKLAARADYEDLRRELEMVKAIEFSTGDDDENIGGGSGIDGSASKDKKESLEQLLLARNKKLTSEMTVLRVSHQDLQKQLEELQEELSRTNVELEKSQNLASTLENDLLRVQREAAFPSSAMSVAGTYSSRYPRSSQRGRVSPTSSIISGFDSHSLAPNGLDSLRSGDSGGVGGGILPMIQAQRDRFKQKNAQLEEELQKTYATVTSLRQEISSLQKDNLTLYEKSRYASAYNRGAPSRGDATIPMSSDTSSGLSLDRYKSQYEANISPFAAFRGRESARAYKRMSLPERMIFSATRMVLANRTSRNLFAAYCLGLHFMIFLTLYWMGTTDVEQHASNLSEVASNAAGMAGAAAGGNSNNGGGQWQEETFHGG